nr:EOG090X0DMT [Triops cancriformis]
MDLVEENGDHNGDPLKFEREEGENPGTVQTIVLPQSVIQPTQASVIQSTPALSTKGNLILVSKPANSVIHTASGGGGSTVSSGGTPTVQTLHLVEARDSDLLEDDATKKRREILARRPSYRKILNELGGGEMSVIPASAIQLASQGNDGLASLQTLTMANTGSGGATLVQYTQGQDGQFFVPVCVAGAGEIQSGGEEWDITEPAMQKRELRLLKNREAARECRRKKKEYIKCLENRVAVLENQNKALIEELKSLKELYCSQKPE